MKSLSAITLAAGLTLSLGAVAGPVTLTFEGVGDLNSVGDYYNGAAGGGTNYGISFSSTPDAVGLVAASAGGSGNFSNEPTANTVLSNTNSGVIQATMAAGFTSSFSFFYSLGNALTVDIQDASGKSVLPSTVQLAAQHAGGGCTSSYFCNWTEVTINFSGMATSVTFTGTANQTLLDNLTFGSAGGGGNVPEPGSLALAGLALAVLGARALRKPA